MKTPFKTTPFAHQREAFDKSLDVPTFAFHHEQRCGKSKIVVDRACHNYGTGRINAVLIIAPNGTHRSWHKFQWPRHAWDHVPIQSAVYSSNAGVDDRRAVENLFELTEHPCLRVLHMNVESFSASKKALALAKRFLECFDVYAVIDESDDIKEPTTKRTKNILKLRHLAVMRDTLTGTPATRSPLNLYTQFAWMDPEIIGFKSYFAFRNRYAILRERRIPGKKAFKEVVDYQNMDELLEKIAPYRHRVTKDQCFDLPERTTTKLPIQLTKRQRALYDRLKNEALIDVTGEGDDVAVTHVLAKLMRLQQIIGGWVPADSEMPAEQIEAEPPKLVALVREIDQTTGKWIIWSRFRPEIEAIVGTLSERYGAHAVRRYDGTVDSVGRVEAEDDFQNDPDVRFIVLQEQAGCRGIELSAASYMYWYSANLSLRDYLQANERPHSAAQTKNVAHIHPVAEDTIDSWIIDTLESGKEIADMITGDDPKKLFQ